MGHVVDDSPLLALLCALAGLQEACFRVVEAVLSRLQVLRAGTHCIHDHEPCLVTLNSCKLRQMY